MSEKSHQKIETFIREAFDRNFEYLQVETGSGLAYDIKDMALQQVLYYWKKLHEIATSVTETEVRLNLPGQHTRNGVEYGIEGVVDIVQEDNQTVMYDIKTHDPEYVRNHKDDYCKQLNVYAHIWQTLREQPLDQTAIIATAFPDRMKEALANRHEEQIQEELDHWQPVVDIPFDSNAVDEAIDEFGTVVDAIENGFFEPPTIDALRSRTTDTAQTFAYLICRNCDARFSCDPYRVHAGGVGKRADRKFLRQFFSESGPNWETESRTDSRVSAAEEEPTIDDLIA